jgi:TM2 domain-containing membrane protein YozV
MRSAYGTRGMTNMRYAHEGRTKGSFLFGEIGVDRFMRGPIGLGMLKRITLGGIGVWRLIDWIIALTNVVSIMKEPVPKRCFGTGLERL